MLTRVQRGHRTGHIRQRADQRATARCRAVNNERDLLTTIISRGTALLLAAACSALPAHAVGVVDAFKRDNVAYEELVHSQQEAGDEDLYTRDAWLGMKRCGARPVAANPRSTTLPARNPSTQGLIT
jgi:hypothetical protein